MADEHLTQMSLTMPDTGPAEPWPFKPGDVVRAGVEVDELEWLDIAPPGVVLRDGFELEWKRHASGWAAPAALPAEVAAGPATSAYLAGREPLTVVSVPEPYVLSPEPTRAVRRAAAVLFEAELSGLIFDDVRAGLAAAFDVGEVARALFAFEYPDRSWTDAEGWMQARYVERATALRTAIVGAS
ncbi:hypothetical protein APR04_003784 [Promicromonospora umidemergens]|uniref:Nucleotidyltransferase AbiEii toxin of type IV toxin-antitoxin system n=1 Tax=Promicromonospora umidemergens TaxID=629679 RepID=A0ABP8XGW9_9MICO|nr:hypothetical protein [Promicromonospora umidemergens]MCP2284861.1 hypothetical protein [Promicromonospora umidemergens]